MRWGWYRDVGVKPHYHKEVCAPLVKYCVGCSDGNVGFEGGLVVTLDDMAQGRHVRAEVARVLLDLRRDLRERLQNSLEVRKTSNAA
jgi:hypothetical protein